MVKKEKDEGEYAFVRISKRAYDRVVSSLAWKEPFSDGLDRLLKTERKESIIR